MRLLYDAYRSIPNALLMIPMDRHYRQRAFSKGCVGLVEQRVGLRVGDVVLLDPLGEHALVVEHDADLEDGQDRDADEEEGGDADNAVALMVLNGTVVRTRCRARLVVNKLDGA